MGSGASSSRGSDRPQGQMLVLHPTRNGATSSTANSNHVIMNASIEVDNNPVGDVARTVVPETSSNSAHVISSSVEPQGTESSGKHSVVRNLDTNDRCTINATI